MSINVYPPVSGASPAYLVDATQAGSASVAIPAGVYDVTLGADSDISQGFSLGGREFRNVGSKGLVRFSSNITSVSTVSGSPFTWTARTSGFGTTTIRALTFGNNTFVAAGGSGTLTTSTNGITWTTRTSGFGTTVIMALTFGNNTFVAAGVSGTLTTSTDGITWTTRTSGFGTTNINALTFGNNTFVAAGGSGTLTTSQGEFSPAQLILAGYNTTNYTI